MSSLKIMVGSIDKDVARQKNFSLVFLQRKGILWFSYSLFSALGVKTRKDKMRQVHWHRKRPEDSFRKQLFIFFILDVVPQNFDSSKFFEQLN